MDNEILDSDNDSDSNPPSSAILNSDEKSNDLSSASTMTTMNSSQGPADRRPLIANANGIARNVHLRHQHWRHIVFVQLKIGQFWENIGRFYQRLLIGAQAKLNRLWIWAYATYIAPNKNVLGLGRTDNLALCKNDQYNGCRCPTLADLASIEEDFGYNKIDVGIKFRWEMCDQQAEQRIPVQLTHSHKPKAIVHSRPLAIERSGSRHGHSSRESPFQEDDDLDSVSLFSGTPISAMTGADNTKLTNIEQQLLSLQKQMALLIQHQQQQNNKVEQKKVIPANEEKIAPKRVDPPLAPPLPPSFNLKSNPVQIKPLQDGANKMAESHVPSNETTNSSPPTKQQPAMLDVLKDIRNGAAKLKKVNRSPGGTILVKRNAQSSLQNGSFVASVLARALGERRKRMQPDSEDHNESGSVGDTTGEWSDGEESENVQPSGPPVVGSV